MSADVLRRAADRLDDPALCNTNPWDASLAAWLRADAELLALREAGNLSTAVHRHALAVARSILGDDA